MFFLFIYFWYLSGLDRVLGNVRKKHLQPCFILVKKFECEARAFFLVLCGFSIASKTFQGYFFSIRLQNHAFLFLKRVDENVKKKAAKIILNCLSSIVLQINCATEENEENDNCPVFKSLHKNFFNISQDTLRGTLLAVISADDKDSGRNGEVRFGISTASDFNAVLKSVKSMDR